MNYHKNSGEAYVQELPRFSKREQEIIGVLKSAIMIGGLTDRKIQLMLGYADKNAVSPRITEMVERGVLVEVGHAIDGHTGKKVRIVNLAPKESQQDLAL